MDKVNKQLAVNLAVDIVGDILEKRLEKFGCDFRYEDVYVDIIQSIFNDGRKAFIIVLKGEDETETVWLVPSGRKDHEWELHYLDRVVRYFL